MTIPISHFCERARWALDLAEVDYDEEQHLQFFSWRAARRAGGSYQVPVLVTPSGSIADSGDIVQWASVCSGRDLRPDTIGEECRALEVELAGAYADAVRRIAYSWFFDNLATCMVFNFGAAPRWQSSLLRWGRPAVMVFARRYVRINPQTLQAARDCVVQTMDRIAERLSDGRPFLMGNAFTAADLTFASLSGPSVLPEKYGMPLPSPEMLDPTTQAWIESMRAHPAGAFALRMYERRPPTRASLPRPLAHRLADGS